MTKKLYPMTFRPVYKDYLWGGSRIPETFHRPLPEGIYAESWEIADRNDGMSVVTNGPLAGQTLHALLEDNATGISGTRANGTRFPLLIKLIDARQKLSVQVHPNTKTAATFGGEAKTEMWYLLGDNETELYCGLKKGITREKLIKAIDKGTCGETLPYHSRQKRRCCFCRRRQRPFHRRKLPHSGGAAKLQHHLSILRLGTRGRQWTTA